MRLIRIEWIKLLFLEVSIFNTDPPESEFIITFPSFLNVLNVYDV